MTGVRGGLRPPQPRDARGRFVSGIRVEVDEATEILQQFLANDGFAQFEDPLLPSETYTLKKGKSMKGYPVRLFHSKYQSGAWHPCRGAFDNYGEQSRYGYQLAISPNKHYGWPGDKWEGEWTIEGMASLLIHLALSVRLRGLSCGAQVGHQAKKGREPEELGHIYDDDNYEDDDYDEEDEDE